MNTKAKYSKRTIQYIDPTLQRKVILGLIVLELLLVGGGLVYLHNVFNEIVELRSYSVNPAKTSDASLLVKEVLITSVAIFLLNIPIILMVVSIWADSLRNILRPYSRAMSSLANLDFRKSNFSNANHPLVIAVYKFFYKGRSHHLKIRQHVKSLDHSFTNIEKSDDEKSLQLQVNELLSILGDK